MRWAIILFALVGFLTVTFHYFPVYWSKTFTVWNFPINFGWIGLIIFTFYLLRIKMVKGKF